MARSGVRDTVEKVIRDKTIHFGKNPTDSEAVYTFCPHQAVLRAYPGSVFMVHSHMGSDHKESQRFSLGKLGSRQVPLPLYSCP